MADPLGIAASTLGTVSFAHNLGKPLLALKKFCPQRPGGARRARGADVSCQRYDRHACRAAPARHRRQQDRGSLQRKPPAQLSMVVSTTSTLNHHQQQQPDERSLTRSKHAMREASFKLPDWTRHSMWQLSFRRSAGNWTLCLTVLRDLPWQHEVWGFICNSSTVKLKELVENGTVTVNDRDPWGNSLLGVSNSTWYLLMHTNVLTDRRERFSLVEPRWQNI